MRKLRGTVHKYGADVDTDVIIPARYLNLDDPADLAKHAMEDIDAGFSGRVRPGDVIVAATNFGCGSSREHAPLAIKAAGVSAVIAESFARIFFRNAINIGLPLLESAEAAREAKTGDALEINLEAGEIRNITTGVTYRAMPYPPFLLQIIGAGGLVEHTKRQMEKER